MKRIFFMCSLPMHREVVRALVRRGVRPVLIDVAEKACGPLSQFAAIAPEAELLETFGLYAAKLPAGINVDIGPVDEATLEYLAPFEAATLQMMDRRNYGGASVQELRELFLRYAALWQAMLDRHRPDAVVFHGTPHQGYDFVLYHLCRRAGVRTLMLERTFLDERMFFREHLRDCPRPVRYDPPTDDGANGAAIEPANAAGKHYAELNRQINDLKDIRYRLSLPFLLKEFLDFRYWGGFFQSVVNPINGISQARPSGLRYQWHETKGRLEIRRGLREYERLCGRADLAANFVYFALHYQPERTTLPDGGAFSDQVNMARILAAALPRGWRLYVREHPRQFRRGTIWHKVRNEDYYRRLAAIPGVELVPLEVPAAELTARCRAACTVTGSTAWEAVQVGRPGVVFGFPWYLHCPGIARVTDIESCRELYGQIERGEAAVDPNRVAAFAAAMTEKYTFRGCFTEGILKLSGLTHEENGEFMGAAIHDALESTPDIARSYDAARPTRVLQQAQGGP